MRRLEEVFTDPNCLRVLYFLTRENPKITIATVCKELKMREELAESILTDIASLQIARREDDKGFTLTDEGLAILFNFHTNFVDVPHS